MNADDEDIKAAADLHEEMTARREAARGPNYLTQEEWAEFERSWEEEARQGKLERALAAKRAEELAEKGRAEWRRRDAEEKRVQERVTALLSARGVRLNIRDDGCGCCGGTVVTLEIDGERFVDDEDFYLEMIEVKP